MISPIFGCDFTDWRIDFTDKTGNHLKIGCFKNTIYVGYWPIRPARFFKSI
jgi:hypothetical protein